jgi:hypothetical protein
MNAEIIKRNPSIRRLAQVYFGGKKKSGLYVKFTDKTHKKWIGCFAQSEKMGLCKVITDKNESECLVIANGKGYLVDIERKEIIAELDEKHLIVSAIKTNKPEFFVAGMENNIWLINPEGKIKEIIPDFYVDGFYLNNQQNNSVTGWLESSISQFEDAIEFKIDLSSFNLIVNYS